MENFRGVAAAWLDKLKAFAVGVAAFLFVTLTCAGSFLVGTIVVFAGVAMIFARLLWPIFIVLALLAGIGLMLGGFVL